MFFTHRTIIHIGLLLTLVPGALVLPSCNKLIAIPANAPSQIVTAQVFADSADATAAVVELYTGFSFVALGLQAGGFTVYPALSADELVNSVSDEFQSECYTDNIPVTDGTIQSFWAGLYSASQGGIYQANACITGITESTGISDPAKNQLTGEAEVVRAFLYFNMVNWFGGVPLVTSTDYLKTASLPRATTTAVYAQIIADLKDAEQRLTPAYPSARKGRPNKYTAAALLAKVYLYTGDWKDAATEASTVINSGGYTLEPNLNNVFLRGSNEAIWSVESVFSWIMTTEGTVFVPNSPGVIPNFTLTGSLLHAFEPGDQRLQDWVGTIGVAGASGTVNYLYPYKYKNGSAQEDYVIFRLGEQYLIRAEAESALGDQGSAVADLNAIRLRAGLSGYAGPTDADSVQAAILHERQVELFCEFGNRWFDLKRTGKVNTVLGLEKPSVWPSDGHAALYPIPQGEIQKNAQLTQNPGY